MKAHSRSWKQFTHNTVFKRGMHSYRGGRGNGREIGREGTEEGKKRRKKRGAEEGGEGGGGRGLGKRMWGGKIWS